MKTKELAEMTGMSLSYNYKMMSQNLIPHYKFGNHRLLFKEEEILGWLREKIVKVKTNEELRIEAKKQLRRQQCIR
jgi:excisionase family DNA binding protein